MKAQKRIFWILTLLPLAVNLASLPFLPDRIPAHYGWDDQVTRWGSKYETLLFPVVTLFFGAVMLAVAEASGKGEKGKNNRIIFFIREIKQTFEITNQKLKDNFPTIFNKKISLRQIHTIKLFTTFVARNRS